MEIRYADVLLMYAEVQARLGNSAEAIKYVNVVRERAGLANLNPALSSSDLLEAIFTERSLEFALEGKRFLDIVRWGKGVSLLGSFGYNPYNSIWPIPHRIISDNPNITQNPGYVDESTPLIPIVPRKNEYTPSVSFPWIRNAQLKVSPLFMKQYKYNFCMDDSLVNVQASYSYNDKNLMTGYVEGVANSPQIYREIYTYDNTNRLICLVKMENTTGNWDTIQANFFLYPGIHEVVDSLGVYYSAGSRYFTVNHYTWNNLENFYQNKFTYWSNYGTNVFTEEPNMAWETKTLLTYNSDNQITNELTKRYDKNGGIWKDVTEVENIYSNGALIKCQNFNITSGKTMTAETIFGYDANKKLISEKNYQLTGNMWSVSNGSLFNYGNSSYGIV